MNYTLHQLEIFLKITQKLSITKASEELFMTQPAVSIQLKNFQNQFEIPLTEIVGRQLYVTEFGKEIAIAAENILNQVHAINYKTEAYQGRLAGRLKISVVSTGKYIMPYFLSGFTKKHSGVELVMDVTNKGSVVKSLEQNKVDFSLVSRLPSNMNIEKIDLLQNKLFLVGGREVQFKKKKYGVEVFKDLPLIYRESGSGTLQSMQEFIDQNRIETVKKMSLTSNEALKQALIAGMGYSIMPLIGLKNELLNGDLQIIPVNGLPIQTEWCLIWLRGKKHAPAAQAFIDYLKENREEIVKTSFSWYEKY